MAEALHRSDMTAEEFLQWSLSQKERYELVDGVPVPLRSMAGATGEHGTIVVNVIALLRQMLAGTPCRPRTGDTAVRTKIDRVRRPDVTIECAPVKLGELEARNPVAVFEVLSPTTRQLDRSEKYQEYIHHPSLRAIVHVDPTIMDVMVFTRGADGTWEPQRLDRPEDVIQLVGLPVSVPLSAVYDGVPLPTGQAGQDNQP